MNFSSDYKTMKDMKNKATRIILDLEFTGLPRYNYEPEICQILLRNVDSGKTIIRNFKTDQPMTAGALVCCGGNDWSKEGNEKFSKEEFDKLLSEVGVQENILFFGFGMKTDIEVLRSYGIRLTEYYIGEGEKRFEYVDLQELARLDSELEYRMATEGSSLETVTYLIFNTFRNPVHGTEQELDLIHDILNYLFIVRKGNWCRLGEYLNYVPWGPYAGMKISEYVVYYRRQSDGYRFNNYDLFSLSLNNVIEDNDYEYEDENFD